MVKIPPISVAASLLKFLSVTGPKVISPTFDQAFPSGTYAVIGLEFTSPSAVIARVIFPGSLWRPGVVAQTGSLSLGTVGLARTHRYFYDGTLGVFGYFQTSAPPSIEVFAISPDASASQEGYLRVIRVGDVGATPPSAASGGKDAPAMSSSLMTRR